MQSSLYIGRFAPSPSGPLHFGSLVAALGSYLFTRHQHGHWLVRMEDLDPPREVAGAADNILRTLEYFGFEWDGGILYQSSRHHAYQQQIEQLLDNDQAYYCQCTRKQIQARGGIYDGRCGQRPTKFKSGAVRIRNRAAVSGFNDNIVGQVGVEPRFSGEDFIIKRSDGLFAYQLAVVMDDHFQGITDIIRGRDLLEASCRQISLNQQFGWSSPTFGHLPLACMRPGIKLSKQNHADAVAHLPPQQALNRALNFLGQASVATSSNMPTMLSQAIAQFDPRQIPKCAEILIEE